MDRRTRVNNKNKYTIELTQWKRHKSASQLISATTSISTTRERKVAWRITSCVLNWQTSYGYGEVNSHRQKWDCHALHAAKRRACDERKSPNLQVLELPGIRGWNRGETFMFLPRCSIAWHKPSDRLLLKKPISFFWRVK